MEEDRIKHLAAMASVMAKNGILEELTSSNDDNDGPLATEVFIFALGDASISSLMPSIAAHGEVPVNVIAYTQGDTMIQSARFTKVDDPNHVLPEINPRASLENIIKHIGQRTYMSYKYQGYLISYGGHYSEDDIDQDQM